MEHGSKVEFTPPESFHAPEGTEAGKEFDLVCTFRPSADGKLCMTKLGDTDMPGYDDKDEDRKPDYSEYSKGLMDQMGESGAPSPNQY